MQRFTALGIGPFSTGSAGARAQVAGGACPQRLPAHEALSGFQSALHPQQTGAHVSS